MANLTPTPEENAEVWQWDGVTPLAGGSPSAPLNRQAQALLNRVQWLKETVESNRLAAIASFSGKNRIINGNFSINQRSFAGGTLSAGAYGHDRWKAGSGGAAYTVSGELATITSGTLVQVIEGVNVPEGGAYTLSWSGTAQARVDGAAYAASPITVAGKAPGVNTVIEFNTGTFGKVQYESGSTPTSFERRHHAIETILCQRYFWRLGHAIALEGYGTGIGANSFMNIMFPVRMRTVPTMTNNFVSPTNLSFQGFALSGLSEDGFVLRIVSASPAGYGSTYNIGNTATAEL